MHTQHTKQEVLATLGAGLFTNAVWDMFSVVVPLYGVAVGLNAAEVGLIVAARLLAQGWRRVLLFLTLPAVAGALWLGFFWWIWGSPSPTAPWGTGITSRIEWIPSGVWGLLFDPQAGLLLPAPGGSMSLYGSMSSMRMKSAVVKLQGRPFTVLPAL